MANVMEIPVVVKADVVKVGELIPARPEATGPQVTVGSIFVSKWGYDQTNVTFYMVQKVTAKTVTVIQVGNRNVDHNLQGYKAMPDTTRTFGKPKRKTVKLWSGIPVINMESYETAHLWDGKPQNGTSYA